MEIHWLVLPVILFLLIAIFLSQSFEKKTVKITNSNGKEITVNVEIADTTAKRMRGLMFRSSLGEYDGMLFVFDSPAKHGFWMVNTTIALDAIFFDENKTAVDIISMEPCGLNLSCKTHYPEKNALYVLEVNKGFAERHSIRKGNKMVIQE